MQKFLYNILLFFSTISFIYCYQHTLKIIYAEVKPFLFKNQYERIDGIIPALLEQAIKECRDKNTTFHFEYYKNLSLPGLFSSEMKQSLDFKKEGRITLC